MVSMYSLHEKYNQVKRSFCFYLDVQDNGVSRTLSKRIEDLGLQQEVFLTGRVTHVVREPPAPAPAPAGARAARWAREGTRGRAHAMLQRIKPAPAPAPAPASAPPRQHNYTTLSVQKAIILLDKIYDTFFNVPIKTSQSIKIFKKHYIKIEFLDKVCRPVYKEFDEWPAISVDPDPPKEKKVSEQKLETPEQKQDFNQNLPKSNTAGQKMTRKSRPRIKEREEDPKGGYCEMCNSEYVDATLHRRSPHHLAFVRDHTNFLSLDSLIDAGTDVTTFLDNATPINGERRSMRNLCNGDSEPKSKRSKRSQSPDSTVNGNQSPKRNGTIDKHNTRCSKRISESQLSEDRQYYKVVSTKLRSSGGFPVKRKDSPPTCNGTKPLVVKFRKVRAQRRSELSVLSDEAEQFMFPKRASSTSSTSSDEDEEEKESREARRKSTPQPSPTLERRRVARPLALKEESSEEDSWPEDKRRRKRRGPAVVKRTRRVLSKLAPPEADMQERDPAEPDSAPSPAPAEEAAPVSPLREEPAERCMKWEDGRLKYTPAVDQLEFAFESVPQSEPWFETFKRQDEDKVATKNVPRYFSLYTTKSPKLPYEIGQLPPLKPNCCPLSDLVKRDEKAGPSRSYGTRGMKRQKIWKKTAAAALIALETHPRKSPREHASTLAILGSAGLRKADDNKSTASEDTVSETQSNTKLESVISETQVASERLQQFLSEVFDDAAEYDMSDEVMEGEAAVTTSTNMPDVLSLVSECEGCEIIRDEIRQGAAARRPRGRRGKLKKNRTGWPKKKLVKKSTAPNSPENKTESSLDGSSADVDDDTTQESASEAEEPTLTETDGKDDIPLGHLAKSDDETPVAADVEDSNTADDDDEDDKPLQLDVKVLLDNKNATKEERDKRVSRSSMSESDDKEEKCRKKKRCVPALGDWLQPVVRVARVDPNAARRLRSAGRGRSTRFR